jgi:hypothetical protein
MRQVFTKRSVTRPFAPLVTRSTCPFAGTDNPKFVADTIINFIRRVKGKKAMADIYLGNEGIWKGDEALMISDLRAINGINAE